MDALYHYCSSDTFTSIVHGQSIWLSSLSLSNDTMEGRLVNKTLMHLADRDQLDIKLRECLQHEMAVFENLFDGLGFCLSEDGDLLSQWRGYADDAHGVSIGFNRMYLERLADLSKATYGSGFNLLKVEYEPCVHEAEVAPTYHELHNLLKARTFTMSSEFYLPDVATQKTIAEEITERKENDGYWEFTFKLLELFPSLFRLKAPAFREEREWRLLSIMSYGSAEPCHFRSARNRIIPYRAYSLPKIDIPAISEVVLGPRHETPIKVVESMLKQAGFGEAKVRRSDATYR